MIHQETTDIWDKYQNGVDHHHATEMYEDAETNNNFYIGEQWKGVFKKSAPRKLPMENFIKPTIKYKTAMVAMNKVAIIFSAMDENAETAVLAKALTKYASRQWEHSKMDSVSWDMIKRAAITGDSWLYCYVENGPDSAKPTEPDIKHRIINNTNIYLADEQNPNISEQEYIIISERIPVSKAREIAKRNKIKEFELITSDEETETQVGESKNNEVKNKLGKCTSLLFMRKVPGGIEFCRSTKTVVYEPLSVIPLDTYPIAPLRWENNIGTARGLSAVKYMIPNQISVNQFLWRMDTVLQDTAYPKMAYDANKIQDAGKISNVGATIPVDNLSQNRVSDLITYLTPPPVNSMANTFMQDMIDTTQKLEGAGDAATGQINPENASGEAIKAARDQAAIPLNEPTQNYQQFVEDLALVWFKLWAVYSVNGIRVEVDGKEIFIPPEVLKGMTPNLKVDISPVDPFSVVSQEISIDRLFNSQLIQNTALLKEYVEMLDDTSTVPKSKLEALIKARKAAEQAQMNMKMLLQENEMLKAQLLSPQQMGGVTNEVPQMQY